MKKKAIILGASGLVGGILLDKLLHDQAFDYVLSISRTSLKTENTKLDQLILDLNHVDFSQVRKDIDVVFCCIGTTSKKTPDQELYKTIDFGIPTNFAAFSKENNIPMFQVISALGADKDSKIFYNRTKGEMEEAVLNQHIPYTYILQPSLIEGPRKEFRLGEKISIGLFSLFSWAFVGKLKPYSKIKAETIAQTMLRLAINPITTDNRISSERIKELAVN
jgi:uncharacterized protein YbjT (DUF2867 family)